VTNKVNEPTVADEFKQTKVELTIRSQKSGQVASLRAHIDLTNESAKPIGIVRVKTSGESTYRWNLKQQPELKNLV
jgi:hypothetical protein